MKNNRFQKICIMFVLCLSLCSLDIHIYAQKDDIVYGDLQVQLVDEKNPSLYRGCKDENGTIYMNENDIATILGGSITSYENKDVFRVSFSTWTILLRTDEPIAHVFYNPKNMEWGYRYQEGFNITPPIYNKEDKLWYFALEEILYLAHAQWICENQTVYVYIPDTVLDVVSRINVMQSMNPTYADFMGEDVWTQLKNSTRYGLEAFIDELDTTFLLDSALSSFHSSSMSTYEKEVMETSILMLSSDIPFNYYKNQTITGFEKSQNFINNVSSIINITLDFDLFDQFQKAIGLNLNAKQIEKCKSKISYSKNLLNYSLAVGETLYLCDNISSGFKTKLDKLIEITEQKKDIVYYEQLNTISNSIKDTYYDDIDSVYQKELDFDHILDSVHDVLTIGGNEPPSNLILDTLDISFEIKDLLLNALKKIPSIKEIFENPKKINISLEQINISSLMYSEYEKALQHLLFNENGVTKEGLENVRLCAQLSQCSAMHAHNQLYEMGKKTKNEKMMENAEVGFVNQLIETRKYDTLLLMNVDFVDMYQEELGCVRMKIPTNYLMCGLPLIDFPFHFGFENINVTAKRKEQKIPKGQKMTISSNVDNFDCIQNIIIHHETYGEYNIKFNGLGRYGNVYGIDMGDGQYTYVVKVFIEGTMGGEEIVILKPENGVLKEMKSFMLGSIPDNNNTDGIFNDAKTLSVTLYPTKKKYEGRISNPLKERTGKKVFDNGSGFMLYELNDEGYYDLIFYYHLKVLSNMDLVGDTFTRYVLEGNNLIVDDQWFEFK